MLDNRIPPPLMMLAVGVVMAGAAQLPPALGMPATWRIGLAGALLAAGLSVVALGVTRFRAVGTTIDPTTPQRASRLVIGGIYRFSRNPMYLGFATILLAWAAQLDSPWALAGPVLFVAFINRYQILPEEHALRHKFGAEFDAYAARVRRWL